MRRAHLLGPAVLALALPAFGASGLDEADAFLVQPMLDRTPLADTITVFPIDDGKSALVPFGELCRLLSFGIQVDAAKGRAEGFFISEKRTFVLDLATGMVDVEGRKLPLPPGGAVRQGQDILVDARLLPAWFPVDSRVDLKLSVLVIKPKVKLPIQEQWEREGKYLSGVPNQGPADDQPVGQFLETPYAFADVPFGNLNLSWSRSPGLSSGQPSATVFLAGDLLWMSSLFSASRDQNGTVSNVLWTLFREDPHGGLLGPLKAKTIELGSILQVPALGAAGSMPQGRGALVDNYPLGYRSKFATRSFTGILEEGWSVELYQNSGLVGFQKSRPDGRYEFRDVALRFGLNQFKLVFHGPFGQVREEKVRLDIAADQPPPGTLFYRVTGLRPTRPDDLGTPADPEAAESAFRKTASLAQMEYGLTRSLALGAGTARVAHPDGYLHTYTDAGLRGVFSYLSAQVDVAQDRAPSGTTAQAREFDLQTGHEYSTLSVHQKNYGDGFQLLDAMDTSGITRDVARDTLIQWDGTLGRKNHPVALTLSHDDKRFMDGGWTRTDTARATFTYPTFTLSPSLSRIQDSGQQGSAELDASVFLTGTHGDIEYQAELDATRTDTDTSITGWSVEASKLMPSGLVYKAGMHGSNTSLSDATALVGVSKLTGRYGFGVDVQYSKAGGTTFSLRAQIALGREPRTHTWISDARPIASQGALSTVAFLDTNGNKKLDGGERILEETAFKTDNQAVESAIKDPKVVFKTLMPRGQDTVVQVDESSLEDPAWQSTVKAYRIVPRPGKVACVDFPVAAFGEIDGTTRIRREGHTEEFGGLEVELLKDGTRFRVLRSAYDGYFELRDLPLGDYVLRISPSEVERLKLKDPPTRSFHVDPAKNLFEGQDLTVEAAAPSPSPTPSGGQTP